MHLPAKLANVFVQAQPRERPVTFAPPSETAYSQFPHGKLLTPLQPLCFNVASATDPANFSPKKVGSLVW